MKKTVLLSLACAASVALIASAAGRLNKAQSAFIAPVQESQMVKIDKAKVLSVSAISTLGIESVAPKAVTTKPGSFTAAPLGALYSGLSNDWYSMNAPRINMAPWQDVTFTDLTKGATTKAWTYSDATSNDTIEHFLTSTDSLLKVNYPAGYYTAPTMKASNSLGDSTYVIATWLQPGGRTAHNTTRTFYSGHVNINWGKIYRNPTQTTANDPTANAYWKKSMSADTAYVRGFAEYFNQPQSPYVLNAVNATVNISSGGTLKMIIRKATSSATGALTSVGDTLCTATTAVTKDQENGALFSDLKFHNPVTELDEDLVIDSPIMIQFTAESDTTTFLPFWVAHNVAVPDSHAYLIIDKVVSGATTGNYQSANWLYGIGYSQAWLVGLDMSFNYIHNTESSNVFVAPATGGDKTFIVQSYYNSPTWDITGTDGAAVDSWLTVTPTDSTATNADGSTSYTGITAVKIAAAALPAGTTGRVGEVNVAYSGASYKFIVSQGETGLNAVKVSAVKVAVVGGDFNISAPAKVNAVKVYNVAGQLVKAAAVNGETIVAAQDLANGMYILRFNDGTNVKVIK